MIKYISKLRLVLRCLLVARKENLTGFSTGLTGRSKNLDPTGFPGFHLCSDAHQSQIIGGDADEDHTQIVEGYTVKLLGGDISPIPPRVLAPLDPSKLS